VTKTTAPLTAPQRELTKSVGTTLTRPKKTRRKVFGRRRDRQAEKS